MEKMGLLKTMWFTLYLLLLLHHSTCSKYDVLNVDEEAWSMVQREGKQFVVDGQPFYVNGFNTYWLMVYAVDESTRGKVSEVFQQASGAGLSVCRTWAFNDGDQWQALRKSPFVYDEQVFKVTRFFTTLVRSGVSRLLV